MRQPSQPRAAASVEVVILAGGLSTRMGRDKSRLKLGRRTLLGHIRAAAQTAGLPVRIIRRDLVKRCGPLGGIFTALSTTKSEVVLFLSCDLPFITGPTIRATFGKMPARGEAVFFRDAAGRSGFPFALRRTALPVVAAQLQAGEFSLQRLSNKLGAKLIPIPRRRQKEWFNVNTPEDFAEARRWLKAKRPGPRKSKPPLVSPRKAAIVPP